MVPLFALTWLVLLAGFCLGWQLLRQNGRMLLRLEELEKRLDALEFGEPSGPAGLLLDSPAPGFELPDLNGEPKNLAQFRGRPLLLIFFNPACGFCRELAPKLREKFESRKQKAKIGPSPVPAVAFFPGDEGAAMPQVLLVSTGDAQTNRQFFAEQKLDCPVLLQKQMEVATAYRANGTPCGYLISPEGRIASELAMGAEALLALLDGKAEMGKQKAEMGQPLVGPETGNRDGRENRFRSRDLAGSKIKRDGLKAGTSAPEFQLPLLDGGELSLSELRGRPVLLVFSSPTCGPCNTLAPKLQKFHRKHPEYELVMISRGEIEDNRQKVKEYRLTFRVVLQQQWEISRLYAMFATPVAYLIDEAGFIAADVAVGTGAINRLMAEPGVSRPHLQGSGSADQLLIGQRVGS